MKEIAKRTYKQEHQGLDNTVREGMKNEEQTIVKQDSVEIKKKEDRDNIKSMFALMMMEMKKNNQTMDENSNKMMKKTLGK